MVKLQLFVDSFELIGMKQRLAARVMFCKFSHVNHVVIEDEKGEVVFLCEI